MRLLKRMSNLDHREKGCYYFVTKLLDPDDDTLKPIQLTIYLATKSNSNYVGTAPLLDIARQIVNSGGLNGIHVELNLAKAMRENFSMSTILIYFSWKLKYLGQ